MTNVNIQCTDNQNMEKHVNFERERVTWISKKRSVFLVLFAVSARGTIEGCRVTVCVLR